MTDTLARLRDRLAEVQDLRAAAAVLGWDQETYMPAGAAEARAQQLATLERLAHERFTDDAVGGLLEDLEDQGFPERSFEHALLRVTRRDYDRATKLPADLVADLARSAARAREAWKTARAGNDFPVFAPHLARLVDLNIRKAEALGYAERRYDALLDEYEPGMPTARVASVFADLRDRLVPIVHAIAERPVPDDASIRRAFDRDRQWAFGMDVLADVGYDFDRGRQDYSAHPFTTSFSVTDVRITTRADEHFFPMAFFGTLHECGHALYEQGIDPAYDRTPLADGTSLGMHESQSRLWENLVGRSRPFWAHYYPKLRAAFPDALGDVELDAFYRAVNRVEPTPIRVESDEVTYNLHIMLRFEIENALIDERVGVDDVPELWNEKMRDYLGLTPRDDAEGCLQDIHWSLGAFGYFPTYALGNLMSTQLFDRAGEEIDDLPALIAAGRFAPLLDWLRDRIHRHGRARTAEDLLRDVTGSGLSADSWLRYVRRKFGALYGL